MMWDLHRFNTGQTSNLGETMIIKINLQNKLTKNMSSYSMVYSVTCYSILCINYLL